MPHFTNPEEKTEYDFVLNFNGLRDFPTEPLRSPARDDDGTVHVFCGLAFPVMSQQQNYRDFPNVKTSIYYKISPLVSY